MEPSDPPLDIPEYDGKAEPDPDPDPDPMQKTMYHDPTLPYSPSGSSVL